MDVRRFGLRSQLVGPLALLFAMALGLSCWTGWSASEQVKANTDKELATLVSTLTRPPSFPLTDAVLDKMTGLTGCEFVVIRPGASTELRPGTLADGYRYTPFEFPETHPNYGSTLWVGYPTVRWRERQWEAIRGPIYLGIAVAVASLWLLWQSTRLVDRIHRVKAQAMALVNDTDSPSALEKNDELGDLQRALNETRQRLLAYQQQLREAERHRLLGQFSGGLAHQLRNAATAAKLSVQLAIHDDPLDVESLAVALRQLQRMESMLQQFLQIGKPPTISDRSLVELDQIVQQVVDGYEAQAKHLGVALTVNCHGQQRLLGDAFALGHLVGNLLGNALDAAGPGGWVKVQCVDNVLEISDSGRGPPIEIRSKLFEPFVTAKPQGIGLGLAVAKQVAEGHGTAIEWFRRDESTVFRVTLLQKVPTSDPLHQQS